MGNKPNISLCGKSLLFGLAACVIVIAILHFTSSARNMPSLLDPILDPLLGRNSSEADRHPKEVSWITKMRSDDLEALAASVETLRAKSTAASSTTTASTTTASTTTRASG